MGHHSEAFVGIDTAKLRNAVAVAEAGRKGEVRYLGEIDTNEAATRKLIASLAAKYRKLTFCYEAGPTGYGLQRLIESLGHTCLVVAPSLIPKKVGDRVNAGQTLMIVEAMKTMNPIPAPRDGIVQDVFVGDAQPVEFGETLLILA